VVKAKKGICKDGGYIAKATVIAETTDGSNVKAYFEVIILPEMKNVYAQVGAYMVSVYGVDSGNKKVPYYRKADKEGYIFGLPYTTEVSAPKGVKASIDKGVNSFGGTYCKVRLADYTTNKSMDDAKPSDGVLVKVKVTVQGTNKSATTKLIVARCPDGYVWFW